MIFAHPFLLSFSVINFINYLISSITIDKGYNVLATFWALDQNFLLAHKPAQVTLYMYNKKFYFNVLF